MVDWIKREIEDIASESKFFDLNELRFSPELLGYCAMNFCGKYNANWACPPAIDSKKIFNDLVNTYKSAYVFNRVYPLEDSFDYEGMIKAHHKDNAIVYRIAKKLKEQKRDFLLLKSGSCNLCKKCAYPLPCIHPHLLYPPIEAYGIDVSALAKSLGLRYNNGPNTVTYFNIIAFNRL